MKWAKRRLTDIKAEISLPVWTYGTKYGTPEYWERLEKELNHEAKDLVDFLRDHRSRDGYDIDVVPVYQTECEFCGYIYDNIDNEDIVPTCCQEAIDAYEGKEAPANLP